MKSWILKCAAIMTLLATAGMPIRLAAQAHREHNQQVHYSVITFGTLGGTASFANGVNKEFQVVGAANLKGDKALHAVLWFDKRTIDLGTLGGPNSLASNVNDFGYVVFTAETSKPNPLREDVCGFGTGLICFPILLHRGREIVLPTLGGYSAFAEGLNAWGQASGYSETTHRDATCVAPQVYQVEGVVWDSSGHIRVLPPLPGDPDSAAFGAINDRGDVAGMSGICGSLSFASSHHAVLWRDGRVINLGSLGGRTGHVPQDINNLDQVVGSSDLPGDTTAHAFLWEKGKMRDLGTLPGDVSSAAYSISDEGQISGQSCDVSGNCRAFIWHDGVMTDLNTLIPAHSGLSLTFAIFGRQGGPIVGGAYVQRIGQIRGYLAIPRNGDAASSTPQVVPRVILPESIRRMLHRRQGFAGPSSGFMRLQ